MCFMVSKRPVRNDVGRRKRSKRLASVARVYTGSDISKKEAVSINFVQLEHDIKSAKVVLDVLRLMNMLKKGTNAGACLMFSSAYIVH